MVSLKLLLPLKEGRMIKLSRKATDLRGFRDDTIFLAQNSWTSLTLIFSRHRQKFEKKN